MGEFNCIINQYQLPSFIYKNKQKRMGIKIKKFKQPLRFGLLIVALSIYTFFLFDNAPHPVFMLNHPDQSFLIPYGTHLGLYL